MQIKSYLKIFETGMVKNGCGQSGHGTPKLTVSQKWTDGIDWFFAHWYKFRKAKGRFNDCWVGMVKNGNDPLGSWVYGSWAPNICCILRMNLYILAHILGTKLWDMCSNTPNKINFYHRKNSVKINDQFFQFKKGLPKLPNEINIHSYSQELSFFVLC